MNFVLHTKKKKKIISQKRVLVMLFVKFISIALYMIDIALKQLCNTNQYVYQNSVVRSFSTICDYSVYYTIQKCINDDNQSIHSHCLVFSEGYLVVKPEGSASPVLKFPFKKICKNRAFEELSEGMLSTVNNCHYLHLQ